MNEGLSYTGMDDENGIGIVYQPKAASSFDAPGVKVEFTDRDSLRRAVFTDDRNPNAPLHYIATKHGLEYSLSGNTVILHVPQGTVVSHNISRRARRIGGVLSATMTVCK